MDGRDSAGVEVEVYIFEINGDLGAFHRGVLF